MVYRVSASGLKAYIQCPARWGFKYLADRREGTTTALAFGSRAHTLAEQYLQDGIPPDTSTPEGAALASGLHLLPTPGTVQVEDQVDWSSDGVNWTARIDGRWWSPSWDAVHILDHKFVADPKYALTGEPWGDATDTSLALDIQGLLYAYAHPDVYEVHLHWIYYYKRKCGAHRVDVSLPGPEAAEYFRGKYLQSAVEMTCLATELQGLEAVKGLPTNPKACRAYGQLCPHAALCSVGSTPLPPAHTYLEI